MGFDVSILGLAGERITAPFGEDRDGCPHKGTDFSSSRVEKDFTAGIYGKVVDPEDSAWGTIAVVPLHVPGYRVQYLHCSSIYVRPGDTVQPWTVLGRTGDKAPAGTNISGIHLHLQIVADEGSEQHSCWNGRSFVDPETWEISNPLVGTWHFQNVENVKGALIETVGSLTIDDDVTGSAVTASIRVHASMTSASGRLYTLKYLYNWNGVVAGRQKHTLELALPEGTCTGQGSAGGHFPCRSLPSSHDMELLSSRSLRDNRHNTTWLKGAASSLLHEVHADEKSKPVTIPLPALALTLSSETDGEALRDFLDRIKHHDQPA